jgi:hypothetical protein
MPCEWLHRDTRGPVSTFYGDHSMSAMTDSRRYFSKFYRGFTVQQVDNGWIILNFPNWASYGPVNQGPFGTFQLACYQIDRLLKAQG